jgi:hypothetical protein
MLVRIGSVLSEELGFLSLIYIICKTFVPVSLAKQCIALYRHCENRNVLSEEGVKLDPLIAKCRHFISTIQLQVALLARYKRKVHDPASWRWAHTLS